MPELNFQQEFAEVLEDSAHVANKLKGKVSVFALTGLVASCYIAWLLYTPDSSLIWNLIKCGLVFVPALILCFIWQILAKVIGAPDQFNALMSSDDGLMSNLKSLSLNKPNSFRGLISTIRSIRNEESLGDIMDVIGGIVILANPLFLLVTFISIAILLVLIIIAPFIVIF